eukprot:CAMPEP_0197038024 /NCGR_PEP_ID=MMETSP1384-20130603/15079_1 /TAXON_ID=29189 /ORGANISM="Ammonia sp." /LENGTH=540 /DNA_ID=CAMNT_0042468415 /DNA_START=202 /DNA_END=1824 /DNA_ORIENTATION=+
MPFKQKVDINNKHDPQFTAYHPFEIGNAIPHSIAAMDMNIDGIADLFVVSKKPNVDYFEMNVYLNQEDPNQFHIASESLASTIQLNDSHALVIDANGDFKPDVFGKNHAGDQAEGFWFGMKSDQFVPLGVDAGNIEMSSVSFVDMDQDCRADLVYMTKDKQLRMISNTNFQDANSRSATTIATFLETDAPQTRLFFADVNKDGAMDVIVASNNNERAKLFVYVQRHRKPFKDICDDELMPVEWDDGTDSKLKASIEVTLDSQGYTFKEHLPIIIQDINMDSKVNLVAVLENSAGHQKVFVTSLSDVTHSADAENMDSISSKFNVGGKKIKDLAFFHSGQFPLGLHFVVQFEDNSFEWVNLQTQLESENYGFLSVLPLNNAKKSMKRYGGAMPGVTVKAYFRSRKGDPIYLTAGNLYQSNGRHYLLPFVPFGLGEPESYVEKCYIAYSIPLSVQEKHVFAQPGVPPNSELVLYADPRDKPSEWRLETFLAPYLSKVTLTIIIAVIMCVLGGMWIYLEIQEKKSQTDEKLSAGPATTNNFFF